MLITGCALESPVATAVFSRVRLCDPLDCKHAPLPTEFSSQEECSGLPFPPPGHLPHRGLEPVSPVSPALLADFQAPPRAG